MKTVNVAFAEVFEDVSAQFPKVASAETLSTGEVAVVDQGKRLISGFTNSHRAPAPAPRIVFGDHTKALKFVDFPFVRGADGTKVLSVRRGFHPKFAYHFLRTIKFPDAGYSRHYRYLKEATVPAIPLGEQQRIASILDQADAVRSAQSRISGLLQAAQSAAFEQMFGSYSDTVPLESVCTKITDGTHQSPRWADADCIPFLFISNISSGEISFDTRKFIDEETWKQLTRHTQVEVGDVLYSTVGSYGSPALVRTSRRFAFQRHIAHIKPDRGLIVPEFLAAQLATPRLKRQAQRVARGIAQPTVNLRDIKNFRIVAPSLTEQDFFVSIARQGRAKIDLAKQRLVQFDALFASLQSRAFRGEL